MKKLLFCLSLVFSFSSMTQLIAQNGCITMTVNPTTSNNPCEECYEVSASVEWENSILLLKQDQNIVTSCLGTECTTTICFPKPTGGDFSYTGYIGCKSYTKGTNNTVHPIGTNPSEPCFFEDGCIVTIAPCDDPPVINN